MMFTLLESAVGAVFRRWWGGWFAPSHFMKLLAGFVFPLSIVWGGTENSYAALWVALCVEGLWLNTFNSEGFDMGRNPSKPLRHCILWMGGTNGAYTTLAASGLAFFTGHYFTLLYALTGFLTPLGYLLGWWLYEHVIGKNESGNWKPIGYCGLNPDGKPNYFIDGPGSIGELCLGALALGGLAAVLV